VTARAVITARANTIARIGGDVKPIESVSSAIKNVETFDDGTSRPDGGENAVILQAGLWDGPTVAFTQGLTRCEWLAEDPLQEDDVAHYVEEKVQWSSGHGRRSPTK
jgi:hypothetical protein